jgi:hypothetical protein
VVGLGVGVGEGDAVVVTGVGVGGAVATVGAGDGLFVGASVADEAHETATRITIGRARTLQ